MDPTPWAPYKRPSAEMAEHRRAAAADLRQLFNSAWIAIGTTPAERDKLTPAEMREVERRRLERCMGAERRQGRWNEQHRNGLERDRKRQRREWREMYCDSFTTGMRPPCEGFAPVRAPARAPAPGAPPRGGKRRLFAG